MWICLGQQPNLFPICHHRLVSMSLSPGSGRTEYQAVPGQLCWTCWPLGFYWHGQHSSFPLKPHFWSYDTLQDTIQHPIPWDSLWARPLWQKPLPCFQHREFNSCDEWQGTRNFKGPWYCIPQSVIFLTEKFLFYLKPIFLIDHTSKKGFSLP